MGKNRLTHGTGLVGGLAVDATGTVASPTATLTPTKTIAAAASAKLDALKVAAATVTLTGTTHVTTVAGFNLATLAAPTLTDASAVTVDAAATLAITGAPIAAGSVTLTNAYALWVQGGKARFDGPVVLNPPTALTYTSGGTTSLDPTLGSFFTVTTATGNSTISLASVPPAGQIVGILINNDAGGARTITFGTNFKSAGTLVGTASKACAILFISDGTNAYEISRSGAATGTAGL